MRIKNAHDHVVLVLLEAPFLNALLRLKWSWAYVSHAEDITIRERILRADLAAAVTQRCSKNAAGGTKSN